MIYRCSGTAHLLRAGRRIPVLITADKPGAVKALHGVTEPELDAPWDDPAWTGLITLRAGDTLVLSDTSWDRRGNGGTVHVTPTTQVRLDQPGDARSLASVAIDH